MKAAFSSQYSKRVTSGRYPYPNKSSPYIRKLTYLNIILLPRFPKPSLSPLSVFRLILFGTVHFPHLRLDDKINLEKFRKVWSFEVTRTVSPQCVQKWHIWRTFCLNVKRVHLRHIRRTQGTCKMDIERLIRKSERRKILRRSRIRCENNIYMNSENLVAVWLNLCRIRSNGESFLTRQ